MQTLPSLSGDSIATIENESAAFYASVFEFAPGEQYSEPESLRPEQLAAWGRGMAQLHRASQAYTPGGAFTRPGWVDIVEITAAWLPEGETHAQHYLTQAQDWLASLPAGPGDFGLIHWDLCIDNLSWDGRQFHIFDFDDAAYFWYAADLAFALEDVLAQPEAQRQPVLGPFLDGYRSIRPEIEPWLGTLPGFLQVMNIFKFGRVLHALRSADPVLDPPWLARLRQKLIRRLEEWRQGFGQPFHAGLLVK
jgi:Ser/Thr protein kinase RdoA (MazF antagonist)